MNRRLSRGYFFRGLSALGTPFGVPSACKAAAIQAYTMRMSTTEPTTGAQTAVAIRFAEMVALRSNGQLKIEVYPNFQLAKEEALIDGLVTGVVDLSMQGSGNLSPVVPRFQVLDMPFLFKNLAVAFRVLDGPIGAELFADLEPNGIVGLGMGAAMKELETTSKSVVLPEDMKGMRIRVQSSAIQTAAYQALGGIPVTIDMSEAFVALTQHTVDAVDINLDSFAAKKFYTVVKHVAMSNHFMAGNIMMASKRKFEALPRALQAILKEEAKTVVPIWRSTNARQTAEAIETLKKNGVAFTEIQYPLFRKAVEPVYAQYQSKLGGDLLDRVTRANAS